MSFHLKQRLPSLSRGFTLIELLVVISIISILIALGSTSYQRAVRLSRDSKRKTDLEQIRQALETYRSEKGTYPVTASWTTDLAPNYITSIPSDPTPATSKYYYIRNTTTTYSLCSTLEIPPTSPNNCGADDLCTTTCNYKTSNP